MTPTDLCSECGFNYKEYRHRYGCSRPGDKVTDLEKTMTAEREKLAEEAMLDAKEKWMTGYDEETSFQKLGKQLFLDGHASRDGEVAALKEEVAGYEISLIGQEHRLGSQIEILEKERDQLRAENERLKSDYAALESHHEITHQIINDAQDQSPTDGKALLYNMDQLKDQLASERQRAEGFADKVEAHYDTLSAINQHIGYKFTQPLMRLRDTLTAFRAGEKP
jgi:predicted RNase H-like nuclease (RuvC/YqgF family)